jgi:hypothetical protein
MRKLLDHPQTVDLLLGRMMEDVEPNKPGQKIVMFHGPASLAPGIGFRYRNPIIRRRRDVSIQIPQRPAKKEEVSSARRGPSD